MNALNGIGFGSALAILGGILLVLTRTRFFRGMILLRGQLIDEATRVGDERKAKRLNHEIIVLERRLPHYGVWLLCLGLIIALVSVFLLSYVTPTI